MSAYERAKRLILSLPEDCGLWGDGKVLRVESIPDDMNAMFALHDLTYKIKLVDADGSDSHKFVRCKHAGMKEGHIRVHIEGSFNGKEFKKLMYEIDPKEI